MIRDRTHMSKRDKFIKEACIQADRALEPSQPQQQEIDHCQ